MKTVIIWVISDSDAVLAAIKYFRDQEPDGTLILLLEENRSDEFKALADKLITIPDGRLNTTNLRNITFLLRKAFPYKGALHVVPCDNNGVLESFLIIFRILSLLFRINSIGLFRNHELSHLPANTISPFLPLILPLAAMAFAVNFLPQTNVLIFFILAIFLILYLAENTFNLYLKKYRTDYYNGLLAFQLEERPYVSHGWMSPFEESFLSWLVESKEGLVQNGYDFGPYGLPVSAPQRLSGHVEDYFHFVNTHGYDLQQSKESIFVLGGSVAQGQFSSSSYNKILERLLSDSGHNLNIVPWAIGGYHSMQERLLTEFSLLSRRPKAIINLNFYNDALQTALGIVPGDTFRMQRKLLSRLSPAYAFLKPFFRKSVIMRHIWRIKHSRMIERHMIDLAENPTKLAQSAQKTVSIYLENTLRIHQLCKNEGIKHCVFIQPYRDDDGDNTNHPVGEIASERSKIINACYRELDARLSQTDPKKRVFIPKPIFDPEDFSDEVHLSEVGQKRIAELIFSHLDNILQ